MNTATDLVEIPVLGMTCDHCVGTVRRALEAVPGVRSAAVDLAHGRAEVVVDPSLAGRDRLRAAVEAAGYQVTEGAAAPAPPLITIGLTAPVPVPSSTPPADSPEEWNLAIGGMHCASCVGRVESALAKVPGVREARVNLATERASVVVDPGKLSETALASAVASAGYTARRAELDPGAGAESLRRERAGQVDSWRNRLIVGLILTAPLVVLGYAPVHALGLHTPVGWLMLPPAAALQVYLGGPYLKGAWARLRQGSSNMDTLIALGTSTAFAYSLYQLLFADPHQAHFFSDVVGIPFFVSVTYSVTVVCVALRFESTKNRPER